MNAFAGQRERLGLLEQLSAPGAISVVFQPILQVVNAGLAVHGVECLTRGPRGTKLEAASTLFDSVRQAGLEAEVDRLCTRAVLSEARGLPVWLPLALNVHASTLGRDAGFAEALLESAHASGIAPTRVTVEVVESSAPGDGERFAAALAELRRHGFAFAVDDVGLGHSNLKMFVDVRPDYFKIDRYFVDGVENDPYRRAVLTCVRELAHAVGARVVAEGVESDTALRVVLESRIDLVQGNLFAQPLPLEALREHPLVRRVPGAPHDSVAIGPAQKATK